MHHDAQLHAPQCSTTVPIPSWCVHHASPCRARHASPCRANRRLNRLDTSELCSALGVSALGCRFSFHRLIDNERIELTVAQLWVQLNYHLIHAMDFLPIANWTDQAASIQQVRHALRKVSQLQRRLWRSDRGPSGLDQSTVLCICPWPLRSLLCSRSRSVDCTHSCLCPSAPHRPLPGSSQSFTTCWSRPASSQSSAHSLLALRALPGTPWHAGTPCHCAGPDGLKPFLICPPTAIQNCLRMCLVLVLAASHTRSLAGPKPPASTSRYRCPLPPP